MKFSEFMEFISHNKIATEQSEFDVVTGVVCDIFEMIRQYINKHGYTALSCGSEWLYQDDEGQVDALELVGEILDRFNVFADTIEDE